MKKNYHKHDVPVRNARGKHTRNPGYVPGDWWIVCDVCGCDVYHSESMKTWDGKLVCPDDWEPRHEQDYIRARTDRIKPEGTVRTGGAAIFIETCPKTAVAGQAIAGCAIANYDEFYFLQEGTNNNEL